MFSRQLLPENNGQTRGKAKLLSQGNMSHIPSTLPLSTEPFGAVGHTREWDFHRHFYKNGRLYVVLSKYTGILYQPFWCCGCDIPGGQFNRLLHCQGINSNGIWLTMVTSSNGNIFRVTGHLCGEFTGPRWIPRTKASEAELWCFLWSASEWTIE